MDLYHTSPEPITAITTGGRFGSFLFFSSRIYTTTAAAFTVYSLEIADDMVIDAGRLFYHDDAAKLDSLVSEFCQRFGVDSDAAEEIISERQPLDSSDSDDLWDVQLFTARAAQMLGYRAVRVSDEQGAAYMIDMAGHEAELKVADERR